MVEMHKNRESITLSLVFPLAIALVISLAASLYGMRWVQQQNTNQRVFDEAIRGQQLFRSLLDTQAKQLQKRIEILQMDSELQNAFRARDTLRLQSAVSKPGAGSKVAGVAGKVQLFLVDIEKKFVFSAHNTVIAEEVLERQTLRTAARTHMVAHGLELDKGGRLLLHVVVPWVKAGGNKSYVVMSQDISLLVPSLKELLGCEIFITAKKTGIDQKRWEISTDSLHNVGIWNEMEDCVVLARTLPAVPGNLCAELKEGTSHGYVRTIDFKEGTRHFRGGFVALFNPAQQNIGTLVMLQDVTSEVVSLWAMALYLGGVGLAIALLVFLFFYFYISRLDRRLATDQAHLREAIADKDVALSQTSTMLQHDIARREEVERKFTRVCRQNQLILDAIGEGIFGLDLKGNHTFVNPQAARMLGYAPEELVGQPSHALWHHSHRDGTHFPDVECPIYQTLRDGEVHHLEDDFFWRKDGSGFPVAYTSTPIHEDGRLAGAVVSFKNISDKKKVMRDLVASENRYRAIASAAQDAIILMDDHGRIVYWNPAAERIFGYTEKEALGRDLHDLVMPARFALEMNTGMQRFWASGSGDVIGKVLEMTALRKGGSEFPVELTVSSLRQDEGWWAVGIVRDISEREQERAERENLQAQLRHSQKMEAIGTLAGGIAHDFNNILAAIMGYTELALLEAEEGVLRDTLTEVRKASGRAKDLVAHILAFSRQGEMAKTPVNVAPIIKETLKMLRASLPTTIEIKQTMGQDLGKIHADPTQIHQVLMNLCTNAAHAMRETGGVLEVGLVQMRLEDESILGTFALDPGNYLRLTVRDTGQGIEGLILARIFDPFFTTKNRGEGTGLGLSVVHGIVISHGGAIDVQSVPGEGTSFILYFPVLESVSETVAAAVVDAPPTGKERVLLVDDEVALIEMGERILVYLGYQVTSRTSSIEALELFRDQPDNFDLVITDYTMPNMTGGELAKHILAIRPKMPIVLCTGFSEVFTEERALALGIKGYVMKPISIHDLAKICRIVLEQSGE
ncbi:MAG: PAS domain S-box protein [Desulfurivibrio sp.]|nr:PAS domain S-box protein [Desulfurivibrio sp.]MBU4118607.1 PAS domain S-box protein [Pseudomonadota bacterium]